MTKTMAEVLAYHQYTGVTVTDEARVTCLCGWATVADDDGEHAEHMQEVLTAAGFGLVADAKAEALESAADDFMPTVARSVLIESPMAIFDATVNRGRDWLRARADNEREG